MRYLTENPTLETGKFVGASLGGAIGFLSDPEPRATSGRNRRTIARSVSVAALLLTLAVVAFTEPQSSTAPPVYWVVRYGQSLSVGYIGFCASPGYPACSVGIPGNLMMWSPMYPPSGGFQALQEKVYQNSPPSVESSATSMCNQYTTFSGHVCATANYGWPGASYPELAKGATCTVGSNCFFDNAIGLSYTTSITSPPTTGTGVVQAAANAAKMGAAFFAPAVYYNQGETEMLSSSITDVMYEQYMVKLQSDFQTSINSAIGQAGLVPLFLVQKSNWPGYSAYTPLAGSNNGGSVIGQLEAALDHYSDGTIWMIGPEYPNEYNGGVHMTANGYRTNGGREGKVMHQVTVEGTPWRPFVPRSITLSGTLLRVRFWVPMAPLVFDSTTITPLPDGNKGFEVTDTGGSGVTISSVALTDGETDSVDITLSGTPASTVELRYAWTAPTLGVSGHAGGPRGQVADSDFRVVSSFLCKRLC